MVETNTHRRKRQEGFTLIELVVVVAILGVLAAVLTPRVLGAVDNAKNSSASSTAKQLQVAFERYAATNNGYPGACKLTADMSTDCATALTAQGDTDRQAYLGDSRVLGTYASLNWSSLSGITYTPASNSYTLTATFNGKSISVSPNSTSP